MDALEEFSLAWLRIDVWECNTAPSSWVMEQSCAEITLDTICSLSGINQCACVMFLTLNPADMKTLHCSGLPTSAVQANKAQKRQMSIMRDKGKKKIRAIKKSELIRASETGVPWHSLDSCALSALLETGEQEMGGLCLCAELPSISWHPRAHRSSTSHPELRENPAQTSPGAGKKGSSSQGSKPWPLKFTIHCSLCLSQQMEESPFKKEREEYINQQYKWINDQDIPIRCKKIPLKTHLYHRERTETWSQAWGHWRGRALLKALVQDLHKWAWKCGLGDRQQAKMSIVIKTSRYWRWRQTNYRFGERNLKIQPPVFSILMDNDTHSSINALSSN